MRPTRRLNGYFRSHPGQAAGILGLAGGGVCHAKTVTGFAVRSYRTISPLPSTYLHKLSVLPHLTISDSSFAHSGSQICPNKCWAVYFLWHFPAGRPGWPLATAVPCPARTFLPAPILRIDLWVTPKALSANRALTIN